MIAALVLAHVLVVNPPELSTDAALAKYQSSCTGKKTPECKQLQWQLEYALYEDLRLAEADGQTVDEETVMVAGAADCPQLKTFALTHWYNTSLPKDAKPLVVAAMNDPYPSVRDAAFRLAAQVGPQYERYSRRAKSQGRMSRVPEADVPPPALDAPLYGGATYLYFASDAAKQSIYNTPDSLDKVVAFYKKAGKTILTGPEMKKRSEAAQAALQQQMNADPMAMARAMQAAMAAGKDPQAAMAEMQAGMMASGVGMQLVQAWENKDSEGIKNTRYVVLEEKKGVSGPANISKAAVLFEDQYVGGTSIVFPVFVSQEDIAKLSTAGASKDYEKAIRSRAKAQEILNDPDAQP